MLNKNLKLFCAGALFGTMMVPVGICANHAMGYIVGTPGDDYSLSHRFECAYGLTQNPHNKCFSITYPNEGYARRQKYIETPESTAAWTLLAIFAGGFGIVADDRYQRGRRR